MTLAGVDSDPIAARLSLIRPHLDERAWRLLLGAEAKVLGRGGIKLVAAAGGAHPDTVAQGVRELDYEQPIPGRVRRPGAGRPPMAETDPDLVAALDALVDPVSRGDPESPLRWTTKSTAKLAAELTAMGHRVSARTVAKLLKQAGYSLQANSKTIEGTQHPDRDAQFGYLNTQVERFRANGDPVISVDTKKKELVGNYKAAGREWEPAGAPRPVKVHDFADKAAGQGGSLRGLRHHRQHRLGQRRHRRRHRRVRGGVDPPLVDHHGRHHLSRLGRLLITADSGGSNGSRLRLWKTELAAFAAEAGLDITVCHLPPGTSKWNKIEHRLFSAISRNWRGRPLQSHEVVIETLRATTTSTGLTVNAVLDTTTYDRGIKITDKQITTLEATQLRRHEFHGDWNYTLTADHTPTRPAEPT